MRPPALILVQTYPAWVVLVRAHQTIAAGPATAMAAAAPGAEVVR